MKPDVIRTLSPTDLQLEALRKYCPDAVVTGRTLGGRVIEAMVTITADVAKALLTINKANRPLKIAHVDALARAMRQGLWVDEHPHGIVVSDDIAMVDGQHRVVSVLRTGISVKMKVSWGVPVEWRATLNSGSTARASDVMTQLGHPEGGWIVPMYNSIARILLARPVNLSGSELLSETHPLKVFTSSGHAVHGMMVGAERSFRTGPIIAGLAIAHRKDPDAIGAFAKSAITGAGLEEGSPALLLRDAILAGGASRMAKNREEAILKVLRAAMAHIKCETLTKLTAAASALGFFLPDLEDLRVSLRGYKDDPEAKLVVDGLKKPGD